MDAKKSPYQPRKRHRPDSCNAADLQIQVFKKQLAVLDKQLEAATATCDAMRKLDETLTKLNRRLDDDRDVSIEEVYKIL